jgi:hypothetical protein
MASTNDQPNSKSTNVAALERLFVEWSKTGGGGALVGISLRTRMSVFTRRPSVCPDVETWTRRSIQRGAELAPLAL